MAAPEKNNRPLICSEPGCWRISSQSKCEKHRNKKHEWTKSNYRGNTTESGYGYSWKKLRVKILKRDKYLCQICLSSGEYSPATQVDHIVAKCNGGTDDFFNLQSLCVSCHDKKSIEDRKILNARRKHFDPFF